MQSRFFFLMWSGLLLSAAAQAVSLAVPPVVCTLTGGPGAVRLWNYPHREWTDYRFRLPDGRLPTGPNARADRFLRSPDDQQRVMDPRVLLLLDQIQAHFGVDTVEIISAYRSPAYNTALQQQGRHVATESRHVQGDAVDVHLDEVTEAALRDYAKSLHCGGVGYYPANAFVHLDFGPIRYWEEAPAAKRQLIGEKPIVWRTDRNVYRAGDVLHLTGVASDESPRVSGAVALEHFYRGAWTSVRSFPRADAVKMIPLHKFPFGKFRLHSTTNGDVYSNEFYLKRM